MDSMSLGLIVLKSELEIGTPSNINRGEVPDLQENGMALFLLEGHAVSALVYRWVAFMCSHSDAVQAAVVCCIGMMLRAFYHTLDAFVHIHDTTSCSFVTTYDV